MAYDDPMLDDLDPEGPSAADLDRFGGETITCPTCHAEVYDQATVCPHCGEVLTGKEGRIPAWAVWAAGLVLLAFFAFFVF